MIGSYGILVRVALSLRSLRYYWQIYVKYFDHLYCVQSDNSICPSGYLSDEANYPIHTHFLLRICGVTQEEYIYLVLHTYYKLFQWA